MIVAIVLIVLGIVAFTYQGFTYTTQSKGVDIGSLHLATEHEHHIPVPPVLGAIALIGGILLLVVDKRGLGSAATS
jgi:hypothetical protein